MFLLFERFPIQRRGPDVGRKLMEARLLSDAWQQQEKAHRAKTFEKGCWCFCLKVNCKPEGLLFHTPHNIPQKSIADIFVVGFVIDIE